MGAGGAGVSSGLRKTSGIEMQQLAEVRQPGSGVTRQGDVGRVPAAPATDGSEGITGLVLDLLRFKGFEKTSKQVHQAGI